MLAEPVECASHGLGLGLRTDHHDARGARGGASEADVSAKQPSPVQEARVSRSDVDQGRPRRPEVAARQGSPPPVRLIGSITRRQEFARLSREGRRRRQGCLWVAAIVSPEAEGVRVAYALPRKAGTAVERNRVRRRLRAALGVLEPQVPPGWYLIGVTRPAREISWDDVCSDLPGAVLGSDGGPRRPS